MKKFIKILLPPPNWQLPVLILIGIIIGLGIYILYTSNAVSYLSDDPKACINCHIMVPEYATWSHSSHREHTTCNDCHVPHNNFLNKYFFKAKDGMRHASIFTLRLEPQVIFIKEAGKEVVHQNCIRCHNHLLTDTKLQTMTNFEHYKFSDRLCWDCHREIPHGRVNSLSSTPFARIPVESSRIPAWYNKEKNNN